MSVKVKLHWSGSGKNKHRAYRLDRWQQMMEILFKRQTRRQPDSQKDFSVAEL
ncbi:MAG: hypothetical protein KME11_21220 [Timaviella obliquedivisa GSE-PSE-MK23-08B]|jgi:hypothetical protein|nr:hypothetical protein [Timaviella obliquedivisa GSE-PSE-MK23-08B]